MTDTSLGVEELPNGDFAATGILAGGDGSEATVIVPAEAMLATAEQLRTRRHPAHWARLGELPAMIRAE